MLPWLLSSLPLALCACAADESSFVNDAGGSPDCYSPERGVEGAYDEGATGCTCDQESASVCVADAAERKVALVCEGGRWQSVEDGACALAQPPTGNEGCYSLTQNLDAAYAADAIGCPCEGDESHCVAAPDGHHVSLTCQEGRWQSGEDGACAWAASHAFDQYVLGQTCRSVVENAQAERESVVLTIREPSIDVWVQRTRGDEALSEWHATSSAYEVPDAGSELTLIAEVDTFERSVGSGQQVPSSMGVSLRNIALNQWEVSLDGFSLPDPLPFASAWFDCAKE